MIFRDARRDELARIVAPLADDEHAPAQIEGVRVAAPWRGQGLGRAMLGWAIEAARQDGCGLVQLTSDKRRADAIRFYESLGFEASHEGLKLPL
ncbi:MAG: GNAT family N-acetyltransferase [Trebonia sp.]